MEKPSFVSNGVLRLPPGFRFHPTDEELVAHYLRRKVVLSFPPSIIPEIDLGRYSPWDLPGSPTEDKYYFNLREAKYPKGCRSNRATGAGYWKATGKDKPVVLSRSNQVVGMKKVLVFYQGKAPKGPRTDWIMHEYRLPNTQNIRNSGHDTDGPRRDWVLCRIFKKKRATHTGVRGGDDSALIQMDATVGRMPTQSSSCVTEVSDGCNSGEETSSSSMKGIETRVS